MAIVASTISTTQTLEEFRLEYNKLQADVSTLESNPTYGTSITFEGATTDAYETTLTVVDPTADRTITLPNATGTVMLTGTVNPDSADGAALGSTSLEWSDLYLADGAIIYFGADQDINITHVHNTGLTTSGNFTVTGDLTVTGDDLYMGTNTSGYVLVADGTNYNPVAVSGDVTMSTAGAVTIASTAVEGSMLNNNVVSGLTALTSGLATTDELLISDGGTIKRMDISVLLTLTDANATAFAVALG